MMKMEGEKSMRTNSIFKVIFISLFVDLLAFTLILPLLPKILDHYAKHDLSNGYNLFIDNVKIIQQLLGIPESHNQVLLAGMLGSWFSFLQFLSSPLIGALSDRFGRKKIMLMTIIGSTLSYVTWLLASNSFNLFILSRTLGGLSKANVGLSLAIISDVSDESSRGRGMAVVGSTFSLAFISGPLLGAYLSRLAGKASDNYTQLIIYPSSIAICLSMIGFLILALYLEETNGMVAGKSRNGRLVNRKAFKQNILKQSFHYINPQSIFNFSLVKDIPQTQRMHLKSTGMIHFYYLLFYSGLEFTLSFLTHLRFQFSSMDQGKLYLYSGLIMAILQGGYIRRIKGGLEAKIALLGLTMIIPSFIFMGLSTKISHIYLSLTMYAISSAIVVPCLTTIVSSNSPEEQKGAVMGTFRSIGALARAFGPFLASFVFWTLGPTICYIIGGLALLVPHYKMRELLSHEAHGSKATNDKKNFTARPAVAN